MRVVHGKCNLVNGCFAVVLRHCSPCVPERVCLVLLRFRYAHTLTNHLDAFVHTSTERVTVTKPFMEVEKVLVVWIVRFVLLHQWLDNRLHAHLDIRIIRAYLLRFRPVVA